MTCEVQIFLVQRGNLLSFVEDYFVSPSPSNTDDSDDDSSSEEIGVWVSCKTDWGGGGAKEDGIQNS